LSDVITRDVLLPVTAGPGITLIPGVTSFTNKGDSQSTGLEIEFTGKPYDWLSWNANYSYQKHNDDAELFFEDSQAENKINLGLELTHNKWHFNTNLHWVDERTERIQIPVRPVENISVDSYFILNARLAYIFNERVEFSLEGFNLVDDEHQEAPSFDLPSLHANGGDEIGSRVLASLRIKWG
jgi:outer membrane receptor protein involved in Fe transport